MNLKLDLVFASLVIKDFTRIILGMKRVRLVLTAVRQNMRVLTKPLIVRILVNYKWKPYLSFNQHYYYLWKHFRIIIISDLKLLQYQHSCNGVHQCCNIFVVRLPFYNLFFFMSLSFVLFKNVFRQLSSYRF